MFACDAESSQSGLSNAAIAGVVVAIVVVAAIVVVVLVVVIRRCGRLVKTKKLKLFILIMDDFKLLLTCLFN